MKMKKQLFVIFPLMAYFGLGSHAHALGTKDGGGGDEVALEFQSAVQKALAELQQSFPETFKDLERKGFNGVIDNAKVIVVDEALDVKAGSYIQSSVAVNYPETQTILVNRQRWTSIPNDNLKDSIALHEYLSLKGLENTGVYTISEKLWSALSVKQPLRPNDKGEVPSVVYTCTTSAKNMIGIGMEFQISLTLNQSQVIYSKYSPGQVPNSQIRSEIGRTRETFPAVVTNQKTQFYIQARFYNSEDPTFTDQDMILDLNKRVLNLVLEDGRLMPIPCRFIARY